MLAKSGLAYRTSPGMPDVEVNPPASHHRSDGLTQAMLEDWLPGNQAEAEPVTKDGESTSDELYRVSVDPAHGRAFMRPTMRHAQLGGNCLPYRVQLLLAQSFKQARSLNEPGAASLGDAVLD